MSQSKSESMSVSLGANDAVLLLGVYVHQHWNTHTSVPCHKMSPQLYPRDVHATMLRNTHDDIHSTLTFLEITDVCFLGYITISHCFVGMIYEVNRC